MNFLVEKDKEDKKLNFSSPEFEKIKEV